MLPLWGRQQDPLKIQITVNLLVPAPTLANPLRRPVPDMTCVTSVSSCPISGSIADADVRQLRRGARRSRDARCPTCRGPLLHEPDVLSALRRVIAYAEGSSGHTRPGGTVPRSGHRCTRGCRLGSYSKLAVHHRPATGGVRRAFVLIVSGSWSSWSSLGHAPWGGGFVDYGLLVEEAATRAWTARLLTARGIPRATWWIGARVGERIEPPAPARLCRRSAWSPCQPSWASQNAIRWSRAATCPVDQDS